LSSESLLTRLPAYRSTTEKVRLPAERRVKMLALASLIFFSTCGGAFGLEPLIGAIGAGRGLLLILIAPLLWSLPVALMVAELAGLLPEEGGYYIWIRETLGKFWGVQAGCWAMTFAVGQMAIFPVLFVSYLSYFFPALGVAADLAHPVLGALLRWLVALGMIAAALVVNLRSARDVGQTAKVSAVLVLGAFAVMILVWLKRTADPALAIRVVRNDFGVAHNGALLLVLSILAFNYSGWDSASTYAGEVDEPQRNYPRAIGIALAVLVCCYVLPVLAGVGATTDATAWSDTAGWPVIAQMIGGKWLGGLLAGAGLVSTWGLFNAQLLYASRLPYVMARDGWLPRVLARVSPRTGVPKVATVTFCAVTGLFALISFGGLAVIQCLVYEAAVMLELLALVLLRVRQPEAKRSFRVPGGWVGLAYVCAGPIMCGMLVLYAVGRDWGPFRMDLAAVATVVLAGVGVYVVRKRVAAEG
jgi:amino acid transporter